MLVVGRVYQGELVILNTASVPLKDAKIVMARLAQLPYRVYERNGDGEGELWFEVREEDQVIGDPICFLPIAARMTLVTSGVAEAEADHLLSDEYAEGWLQAYRAMLVQDSE